MSITLRLGEKTILQEARPSFITQEKNQHLPFPFRSLFVILFFNKLLTDYKQPFSTATKMNKK